MNKYNIVYSEYKKQIWVLLLFPILMIAPLIAVLLSVKNLSDFVLLTSVLIWMGLMIVAMIYVVNKQLMMPANLVINKDGLEVLPEKKTIFYSFDKLLISFDNIKSMTDDDDVQQNYRKFFTVKTKNPSRKIMLLAPKKQSVAETEACALALHTAIKDYNNSPVATGSGIIKEGSFYTSTFGKVITILFASTLVITLVVKFINPESVPGYRLVALLSFSLLWFMNFFNARRKEKQRLNS
jgi:hypothetical protein